MIFKKHKIVTNKTVKSNIAQEDLVKCIKSFNEEFDEDEEESYDIGLSCYMDEEYYERHHLYILSDEVLKENDWAYNTGIKELIFVDKNQIDFWDGDLQNTFIKKIIATTDEKLGLPLIPFSFLEKFVSLQPISEVEVEYNNNSIADSGEDRISLLPNGEIIIK